MLRALAAACLLFAAANTASAAEGTFFDTTLAANAVRYEAGLSDFADPGKHPTAHWRRVGDQAMAKNDTRSATVAYAAAILTARQDAALWLQLARALAATQPTDTKEQSELRQQAMSAAFNAYRRATASQPRAQALALLGSLLARQSEWRPALDAYRASLALAEVPAVRTAYEALQEEHGFRVTDYSIDSDTASPRLCVQFSGDLAKGRLDFAKFVRVGGKDPAAVTAEEQQLCIEGFRHGERYEVEIRSGVPAANGETTRKATQYTIYVRDRQPAVRFSSRNYVLPRTGQQGLPVVSVNVELLSLDIYRIGDRGLAPAIVGGEMQGEMYGYSLRELASDKGEKIWSGTMPVERKLNEDVTTAIPVSEAVPNLKPGVYVAVAVPVNPKPDEWDARAAQWFIVSDLGLASFSGADGVHGFVRSLASAAPLQGVEVRLVARNNEVLGSARTDADGAVRFDPGLTRGKGGQSPAVLVAQADSDYGFLDLTAAGFDLSDRGVAGRAAPGALDAYVYTERGVYRPGSDVHVTALLRDREARAVAGVPLTLVFRRPDGVEHRRILMAQDSLGGRSYTLSLLPTVMTGTWRLAAYADPKAEPVGETSFLVEDFVPDRMEMSLEAETKSVAPGGTVRVKLDGRFLYGAPAADLALEGDIDLRPRAGLDGFAGYSFGLADESVPAVRRPLFDLPRTDREGRATISAPLPPLPESTRPLAAQVTLRLVEPGGRALSRTVQVPVAPAANLIGVRPLFSDGHVGSGTNAGFEIVGVAPDGRRADLKGLRWQLFKLERRWQWYREYGQWQYEAVTLSTRLSEGQVDTTAATPARIDVAVDYGRYRLEIAPAGAVPGSAGTSFNFTAGWYGADAAETPDFLDIALDKASYRPGETARVSLTPRNPGKALVAVVRDGIVAMKTVEVGDGPATAEFEVDERWGPGAYVTAMLYRPMDVPQQRMPGRSVGIAWLGLDRAPRELGVKLALPERIRPRTGLDVPVEVGGLGAGEEAYLTVAAVDVGILNLTGYQPPAPEDWYYAQRKLAVDIRDLYGRLIDGMRAQRGQLRSGGDGGGMRMSGSPPTQPPVALYSGIVRADGDGKASVRFEVPAFNGTLRVMAVAWSRNKVGHGTGDVIVRDPVVVTASLPRFLNAGDRGRMHLSIDNVEGPAGAYSLSLSGDGPVEAGSPSQTLTLDKGGRAEVAMPLAAGGIGAARLVARLAGPDGLAIEQEFAIEVKPGSPLVTRRSLQTLAAKTGTITLSPDLFADFVSGSAKASLSVAPSIAFDLPGLLLSLDRYPYGCAEQTTSRALPLLYVNDVARRIGLATDAAITERVQKAIDTLMGLQSSSGGFGLWGPGDEIWLTAYVADFLARAKERNYTVPETAFRMVLDRLHNHVVNTDSVDDGGEALAYALYVLARTGRANVGDLRYYADTRLADFDTPLAKAQIGAGLAMYGDTTRAERVFATALGEGETVDHRNRIDYGSLLRDRAALLTLAAETGARKESVPAIARQIATMPPQARGNSTQENAWLLLAAHALQQQSGKLALNVDGQAQDGPVYRAYAAGDLATSPVRVDNAGDAPVTATVTVTGAPLKPEPAADRGLTIVRRYFNFDGSPRTLDTVTQNERIVVTLKVTEVEAMITSLMIADHIPAGFEIENPRLAGGASGGPSLPWFSAQGDAAHKEYRDDRFLAAYELDGEDAAEIAVAYVMRAVAPGSYVQPAAVAEDMYRSERFARTATGRTEIATAR